MNELTSDGRFDRDMTAIAARAAYPAAPALRAGVLAAIDTSRNAAASLGNASWRSKAPWRGLSARDEERRVAPFALAAAITVVVAAIAAVLAVPTSRSAVADFFGIEGSEIEVIPSSTPLPPPEDIRESAELTTVESASVAVGFELALPSDAGTPGAVYLVRYGTQTVAVLRYRDFDLWEARLQPDVNFGKGAPASVNVTDTFVGDSPARWISGGPHIVQFNDTSGEIIESSVRTVDRNTLIWNHDETFFRMETALPFEDALRIAESLP